VIDITQRRYQHLLSAEAERDDYVTAVQRMAHASATKGYERGWHAAMQRFSDILLGVMAERKESDEL
jgi:hypothetical protein